MTRTYLSSATMFALYVAFFVARAFSTSASQALFAK
jgi:hypothetical protein